LGEEGAVELLISAGAVELLISAEMPFLPP
jgi:hypothetical protein